MNAVQQAETLLEYFRDLPESEIDQEIGTMRGVGHEACFGAHVAFALDETPAVSEWKSWTFIDGIKAMHEIINSTKSPIYDAFAQEGILDPYGADWPKHPYEVLTNIFDRVGLVKKVPAESVLAET